MKPKDDLFLLVKSLSKAEKRFFSLFAQITEGEKNYIKLFNALEKMAEYDEEKLKKKYANERFIKNLAFEKNHLQKQILKALRVYQTDESVETRSYDMLKEIHILHEKHLYDATQKHIKKLKALVAENEYYSIAPELAKAEYRSYNLHLDKEGMQENFAELYHQSKKALDILNEVNETQYHSLELYYTLLRKSPKDEATLAKAKKILSGKTFDSADKTLSALAADNIMQAQMIYCFYTRDIKGAYEWSKKRLQLFEEKPFLIGNRASVLISAYSNHMAIAGSFGKHDEFFETLAKLKSIKVVTQRDRLYQFRKTYMVEMKEYLNSGDFEKAKSLIPIIDKEMEESERLFPVDTVETIRFNYACTYIGLGDYKAALKYLNEIVNNEHEDYREIFHVSLVLRLFVLYELGKTDVMRSFIDKAEKFFKSRDRLHKFEKAVFVFLKKLLKQQSKKDIAQSWATFHKELEQLFADKKEMMTLAYFDFIAYAKSKSGTTSYVQALADSYHNFIPK